MVLTPVPFTSGRNEAEKMRMRFKAQYTFHYKPEDTHGTEWVFVHNKEDAKILVDYWNHSSESWEYALVGVYNCSLM